jgi:nucleotide-binding universal stress UspA family protein
MYNKILVPLDGSKTAECCLGHVVDIAKGCNIPEVILLFVVEPAPAGLYQSSAEVREKLRDWSKTYLAGVEKSLTKDGVTAKSVIVEGKAAETIVDYAEKNGIDLIIMSTHGRSGPSRWALGSVADKVIRSSTIAVLIAVPKGCRLS